MTQRIGTKSSTKELGGEHSVPLFWPFAAALQLQIGAVRSWEKGLDFLKEAEEITCPPAPEWATPNDVRLELNTMRLREFGDKDYKGIPVIVDAPYAGHSSTIADYDKGQSLVEVLLASGIQRVLVTDWKSATPAMSNFDIDTYLAELNVAIDDVGGKAHLVGLCQGGWLATMLAARFPGKVQSLVLAGSPIDTDAGNGPIKQLAHRMPMAAYERMVKIGGGLMPGRFMLAGWKNMHPDEQYVEKYARLYEHLEDTNYVKRTRKFEAWYENPLDLPGRYYLQAINDLFKQNLLAKDKFIGLGRELKLGDIKIPAFLLAGESDDITTREQVFAAKDLFGTSAKDVVTKLVPGGHIGLFMGRRTLSEEWPTIARWILAQE